MSEVASLSDAITPFLVDRAGVRGRVVKLGAVAETILARYDYPEPVAKLLGELLLVAAMLSSNLKQEGIFTIQIRGNGPVSLVVVDAVYGGALRGFAEIKQGRSLPLEPTIKQLLGDDATFAITLDPGEGMHRYQGVVAIEGESITDMLGHYFTQSQQLDVMFKLAVEKRVLPGASQPIWMAGGLMIERLPSSSSPLAGESERSFSAPVGGEAAKIPPHGFARANPAPPQGGSLDSYEGWRYASAITNTLKDDELLDPLLDAPTLLHRLFHEEGVWVYPPTNLSVGCRCSRERILNLLKSMPLDERADMVNSGPASVHCQFCNTSEKFTGEELGLKVN